MINNDRVAVAITGVAPKPYRATAVETALSGGKFTEERIAAAIKGAGEGVTPMSDMHATPYYRTHLAQVNVRRAIERALARG